MTGHHFASNAPPGNALLGGGSIPVWPTNLRLNHAEVAHHSAEGAKVGHPAMNELRASAIAVAPEPRSGAGGYPYPFIPTSVRRSVAPKQRSREGGLTT